LGGLKWWPDVVGWSRQMPDSGHPRPLACKQLHLIGDKPTQMAIPLQMELKSFVNSWSLQYGA
jgi:hypothetical protein